MGILSRFFSRPAETVYLSLEDESIEPDAYLQAWERIMATPDGKILASVFRNQLLGALSNNCPPDLKSAEERSRWLAAHDAIISARRDLLSHAVYNVQLIKRPDSGAKLPPVGKRRR